MVYLNCRFPVIARNEAIQFTTFLVCFVVPPRNDELRQFEVHMYCYVKFVAV